MENNTQAPVRNKVQLSGFVGTDPEIFEFSNGNKKVSFSLGTRENYKDKEGNWVQNTFWHQVVALGKSAQFVETQVRKGSEISLEGKISYRNYQNKEGKTVKLTEITAFQIQFVEKKENLN